MDLGAVAAHEASSESDHGRDAAILAPVVSRSKPQLLFTRRADHLVEHPGQMSFPGGGREPEDEDLAATALREAFEEVGLTAGEVDVVGRLDDIRTVTGYRVRPFVGRVSDRKFQPTSPEVASVALLGVHELRSPDNYECERREHPDHGSIIVHYFTVDQHTVWGATARILVQLLELTTDWVAPPHVGTDDDLATD